MCKLTLAYIIGVCRGNRHKLFPVMCPGRGMQISISNDGDPSP